MRRGEAGFTVIEVIIVTAITSLLLIGAFVAMTSSIETTRFSDTLTSTQSFLQKQYLEVLTGRNDRDNTLQCDPVSGAVSSVAPDPSIVLGGSACVLLGRMITISPGASDIVVNYIVGKEPASQVTTSESDAIRSYNPRIVSDTADPAGKTRTSYSLPWGAKVGTVTTGGSPVQYFALMRSPISERILIYSNGTNVLNSTTLVAGSLNRKVDVCINSDNGPFGQTGHVMIGAGQGQDLFTLERVARSAC